MKNDSDAELAKCIKNKSDPTCKINEKVLEELNEKILYFETQHMQLVYLWNHVREQLDINEISNLIKELIVIPVKDCFEKAQLEDHEKGLVEDHEKGLAEDHEKEQVEDHEKAEVDEHEKPQLEDHS